MGLLVNWSSCKDLNMLMRLIVSTVLLQACTYAKDEKAFSLFSVVTFKNEDCQSQSQTMMNGPRNGTCYTSTECTDKGGTAEGNCASGFGVCCIITVDDEDGGDVSHNNTIVENKDFPSVYDEK